jgi:hypothetical protein
MRRLSLLLGGLVLCGPAAGASPAPAPEPLAAVGPVIGTCPVFPARNYWNTDISRLPVDSRSAAWLSHMSTSRALHPDFGPSYSTTVPDYGIPVTTVVTGHPMVPVTFDYASESDQVRYPLGSDTRVEGGLASTGDRHTVVVNTSTCRLYETWLTRRSGSRWLAGSGATWPLASNKLRTDGWTSADAAGLPILPGLLRWDEVRAGAVNHAIRFTTNTTSAAHLWPARHDAGSGPIGSYPPMGARFRLAASYDASALGAQAQVVVTAMKHYGLVLADNGSPWYFQGEQNAAWPDALISDLKKIPASAFVAVDTSGMQIFPDSAVAKLP